MSVTNQERNDNNVGQTCVHSCSAHDIHMYMHTVYNTRVHVNVMYVMCTTLLQINSMHTILDSSSFLDSTNTIWVIFEFLFFNNEVVII